MGLAEETRFFGGPRFLRSLWWADALGRGRDRTPSVEPANLPVRLFYSFESPMCRLSELVEGRGVATVTCLQLMVQVDRIGSHVYGWKDELADLLGRAMSAHESAVVTGATAVINDLGRRGIHDFRGLLGGQAGVVPAASAPRR